MNRFIKDNLVLFIVLGCVLLAAIVLLVFSLMGYARMVGYHEQAAELRSQIESLIKQKPAPVIGNVSPMKKEIEFFQKKNAEILPYFANLKLPALEVFTRTLGVDTAKFKEVFRAAWEADGDRKAQGGKKRFYDRFVVGKIPEHDWYRIVKLTDAERKQLWTRAEDAFFAKYGKAVSAEARKNVLFTEFAKPAHEDALAEFCYKLEVDKAAFLKMVAEARETIQDPKAAGAEMTFQRQFTDGSIPEKDWASLVMPSDDEHAARWQRAVAAFRQEYQKLTVEPITEDNQNDILLSLLGVPRNFDGRGELCMQEFMTPMRARIQDLCDNPPQKKAAADGKTDAQPGMEAPNKLEVVSKDKGFFLGFNYQLTPTAEQIVPIVKNYEVVGDLVHRIISEGLFSINSFNIRSLEGTKAGRYTVYHYTFSVSGNIANIRKLAHNLNMAAKENRVYIVNSIFMYADQDGASEIFLERQQEALQRRQELENGPAKEENRGMDPGPAAPPEMSAPGMPDGEPQQVKVKTAAEIRAEEMKKPYYARTGYGRLLFGGTPNCEAVFDVEYVFIEEPELN